MKKKIVLMLALIGLLFAIKGFKKFAKVASDYMDYEVDGEAVGI